MLCEYPVTALWRLSGKFVSVTQIITVMEVIYRSTETLKKLENNPRTISEEQLQKLKESIQKNPDYFEARPIILSDRTGELVIIAGNQRYDACVQLGIEEVPTVLIPNLTEVREREIIIRDNANNGEWDWNILADSWDTSELKDWGMDLPTDWGVSPDDFGDSFSLPSGDKSPFQQMTFTFADEQADVIRQAIDEIKQTDLYKYAETFGNKNANGNALSLIVRQWAEQKK